MLPAAEDKRAFIVPRHTASLCELGNNMGGLCGHIVTSRVYRGQKTLLRTPLPPILCFTLSGTVDSVDCGHVKGSNSAGQTPVGHGYLMGRLGAGQDWMAQFGTMWDDDSGSGTNKS